MNKSIHDQTLLAPGADGAESLTGAFADAATWNDEATSYLNNNDALPFFRKQGRLLLQGRRRRMLWTFSSLFLPNQGKYLLFLI